MDITTLNTPPAARMTPLCATEFTNTSGITFIRLIPEPLLVAEQCALESVGLTHQHHHTVGHTHMRTTYFPAWLLITNPDHVQHVLDIMGDLQWAKHAVKHSAGKVKRRFDQIINLLTRNTPQVAPSLLEELARLFAQAGSTNYAKQYFVKAREIERTHNVPIDQEHHIAVFLQFSQLGIIGAREFSAEAQAATERMTPKAAFDYFLNLITHLLKSGAEAYPNLAGDLRQLAHNACISDHESDNILLGSIIELIGFRTAPADFFTAINQALIQFIMLHPEYQPVLYAAKPKKLTTEQYFTLLTQTGVLAELTAHKPTFAQWLVEFLTTEMPIRYHQDERFSPQLINAILLAGPALAGKTISLCGRTMDLNLIDALSSCGVHWTGINADWSYKWVDWAKDHFYTNPATQRRDLMGVVNHPQLRTMVAGMLTAEFINAHVDLLLSFPATTELVRIRLNQYADWWEQTAGSATTRKHIHDTCLVYLNDHRLQLLFPDIIERLFAFDPVAELQLRLQHGMVSELAWPAMEATLDRLHQDYPMSTAVGFYETYPAVAVRVGRALEVVDGDDVLIQGTVIPDADVSVVRLVRKRVIMLYHNSGWEIYTRWLGEMPVRDQWLDAQHSHQRTHSIPLPEGRLTGYGLLRYPGKAQSFGGQVFGTGPYYLLTDTHITDTHIKEWESGESKDEAFFAPVGRGENIPGVDLTGLPPATMLTPLDRFQLRLSTVTAAQPTTQTSPCGILNGQHVTIVHRDDTTYHLWSPLGDFRSQHAITVTLRRPGGGTWLIASDPKAGNSIIDAETDQVISQALSVYVDSRPADYIHHLPPSAFHQLHPRDLAMSTKLRATTWEQALTLLSNPTLETIAQLFGSNAVLGKSILNIVTSVQELRGQIQKITALHTTTPHNMLSTAALELLSLASSSTRWSPEGQLHDNILPQLLATPGVVTLSRAETQLFNGWWELLGQEKAIVATISAPMHNPETVVELCEWLLKAAASGTFGSGWRHHVVDRAAVPDAPTCEWWHGAWFYGGSSTFSCVLVHPEHTDYAHIPLHTHPYEPDMFLPQAEFVACITAIMRWAQQRSENPPAELMLFDGAASNAVPSLVGPADATLDNTAPDNAAPRGRSLAAAAQQLATGTIFLPETAQYFLAGLKKNTYYNWGVLDTDYREALGLGTAEATAALNQLRGIHHIEWLQAIGVDSDFHTTGFNIDALVTYLQERYSQPFMHITTAQFNHAVRHGQWPSLVNHAIGSATHAPNHMDAQDAGNYLAILLYLVNLLDLGDTRRNILACKLTALKAFSRTQQWTGLGAMDLGCNYGNRYFNQRITHDAQVIRALTEGLLDSLIINLEQQPTRIGNAFDPVAAAPDVVHDAAETLKVPHESARYFLQILALARPTDANVREWNDWKKKDIDRAATPLVEKKLLVMAKRAGAGRTRFLPGGWAEKAPGSVPMEVWKAPHYLLWQDAKIRPIIKGCPPILPTAELFATTWERYKNGGTPGYEKLRTQCYRRP